MRSVSACGLIEEREELAVVTCYFTPQPHARRVRNFEVFRRQFGRNLYVAELAYDRSPWVMRAGANMFHFRGGPGHVMWQKERLLNAVIARLPTHVTHVAWVDADLLFLDRQWPMRALDQMKRFPVVQLFDTVVHLDPSGVPVSQNSGLVASAVRHGPSAYAERKGAAGFAWAARREFLAQLPLPDCMILGGADTYIAGGFSGVRPPQIVAQLPPALQRAVGGWADSAQALTSGRVGHVPGTIGHLYHGGLQTRGYLQRYELLRQAAFDPAADIAVDETGLQTWKTPKVKFHAAVAAYFARRAMAENR